MMTQDISNRFISVENSIKDLSKRIKLLELAIGANVGQSQLKLSDSALQLKIDNNSSLMRKLEDKLSKITLPEDTRYYLEESEVQDFRANFQKLSALMVDVESLYDNMVAYLANETTI